jgi:curved DNA-binding protein
MQFKDYYRILGVAEDASADAIKAAYRKLARQLHPDVNKAPDAQKRFTDLGEAYEALGDPGKRSAYDELRRGGWKEGQELDGTGAFAGRQGHPGWSAHPQPGGGPEGEDIGDQFSDFFQSLFGHAHRRGRAAGPSRGEDIHHAITLTLEESYHGGKRQLHLRLPSRDGSGQSESRVLDITIPKGITQGEHLRLRGQGMPGEAPGHDGDLYLEVELAIHPHYRIDGRDLTLELPLAPWEAVLGAKVDAPTLGGTVEVAIPAGAQDGQRLRLKGRGLPGKPNGDQYLVLRIAVPTSAGAREQALWRELGELAHFDPRAGMKGTP